jgi:type VI secretion system secreted protein VgrG
LPPVITWGKKTTAQSLAHGPRQAASAQGKTAETPPEYRFDIRLQDVPGEDGFPLAHTPWRIFMGDESNLLLQGITNEDGRVSLDDAQQSTLSKAYHQAPQNIWLAYPGQCVGLRLHLERPDWDGEKYALCALDFIDSEASNTAALECERAKQDICSDSFFTYLQSKE